MARDGFRALLLILVMFSAAFAGCFGENELDRLSSEDDVVINSSNPIWWCFSRYDN